MSTGWICPKCNRSINPIYPSCPFCESPKITTVSNTEGSLDD